MASASDSRGWRTASRRVLAVEPAVGSIVAEDSATPIEPGLYDPVPVSRGGTSVAGRTTRTGGPFCMSEARERAPHELRPSSAWSWAALRRLRSECSTGRRCARRHGLACRTLVGRGSISPSTGASSACCCRSSSSPSSAPSRPTATPLPSSAFPSVATGRWTSGWCSAPSMPTGSATCFRA